MAGRGGFAFLQPFVAPGVPTKAGFPAELPLAAVGTWRRQHPSSCAGFHLHRLDIAGTVLSLGFLH